MVSTEQFKQIKASLEKGLYCAHNLYDHEITEVHEIFNHSDLTIYQIVRKLTLKSTGKPIRAEDNPDLLAWSIDSWKDSSDVILCGNIRDGVRSLDVRLIGMFRDAIPDGEVALKPPWSDIPRNIDIVFSIGKLIDEVSDYLCCNGFEAHHQALVHVQKVLALGDKSLDELEEEKYEDLEDD